MKIIGITQARYGSSRLRGKVLKQINGESLLGIHLKRLRRSKMVDQWVVATTEEPESEAIVEIAHKMGATSYKGSLNDVLDRFYLAAKPLNPDYVIRVTSDCPLVDAALLDAVISCALTNKADYCSNIFVENYPDGQDVEVFKFTALEYAWNNATLNSDREHVTPFIRNNSSFKGGILFSSLNFPCIHDYSKVRMTVDEERDFMLMEKLISELGTDHDWLTYTDYIITNNLNKLNDSIQRNEGYLKSLNND